MIDCMRYFTLYSIFTDKKCFIKIGLKRENNICFVLKQLKLRRQEESCEYVFYFVFITYKSL